MKTTIRAALIAILAPSSPQAWAQAKGTIRLGVEIPASIVNVSGMSFGSLSGPAVEALNRGSRIAGCLQSTGEGGVSSHHLQGGDLVWQVGTGYFGCRERDGRFSMAKLKDTIARS